MHMNINIQVEPYRAPKCMAEMKHTPMAENKIAYCPITYNNQKGE